MPSPYPHGGQGDDGPRQAMPNGFTRPIGIVIKLFFQRPDRMAMLGSEGIRSPWEATSRDRSEAAERMRVLLVEDHAELRDMLAAHLRQAGFAADAVCCGFDALAAVEAAPYDAVILDLGLPDLDGVEVLRQLRAGPATSLPILVLTARHAVGDRVQGLDAGADDYLVKPFDMLELDARLRSITRRTERRPDTAPAVRFGDLSLDPLTREALVGDGELALTRREVALLEELLRGGGHTLVRDVLEDRLYGFAEVFTGNALEATVSRLRRRLAAAGSAVTVETVRGIGYRLATTTRPAGDRP